MNNKLLNNKLILVHPSNHSQMMALRKLKRKKVSAMVMMLIRIQNGPNLKIWNISKKNSKVFKTFCHLFRTFLILKIGKYPTIFTNRLCNHAFYLILKIA